MRKSKIYLIVLTIGLLCFSGNCIIYADYEIEREDVYDYKEFFEELYPSEKESSSCTTLGTVYAECSGVTVNGTTYSLEDYVAGVLYAEFHTAINNEEMGKAAAIVIRSYTLKHTNNCSNTIGSSSYEQNFVAESSGVVDMDTYKKYAQDTAGVVINDSSGIVEAVYFAMTAGNCDSVVNGMCKKQLYYRYQSGGTHEISVPVSALPSGTLGSHDSGLAVWAAAYQAENEGYTTDKILKEYYGSDISISKLTSKGTGVSSSSSLDFTCDDTDGGLSSASADGFKRRTSQPESSNKHFFSSENPVYPGENVGQCTWYSYGRASEILENAGSSLTMWGGFPNAGDWYSYNQSFGSKGFKSSTDVNKPKVGAIIVWANSGAGHVGIVEAVNEDNTIDISEANIGGIKSSSNPYGWQYVSNMTISEVANRWGYTFVGYIYILE